MNKVLLTTVNDQHFCIPHKNYKYFFQMFKHGDMVDSTAFKLWPEEPLLH